MLLPDNSLLSLDKSIVGNDLAIVATQSKKTEQRNKGDRKHAKSTIEESATTTPIRKLCSNFNLPANTSN